MRTRARLAPTAPRAARKATAALVAVRVVDGPVLAAEGRGAAIAAPVPMRAAEADRYRSIAQKMIADIRPNPAQAKPTQ